VTPHVLDYHNSYKESKHTVEETPCTISSYLIGNHWVCLTVWDWCAYCLAVYLEPLELRCPILLPFATCGNWLFKCGKNQQFLHFHILGVNFINVKRAHFLYESLFSSYVLALNELSYEKFARLRLMKLTVGGTFKNDEAAIFNEMLILLLIYFYYLCLLNTFCDPKWHQIRRFHVPYGKTF